MSKPFNSVFHDAIAHARAWHDGASPIVVYEALALVCVAQLRGELDATSKSDLDALARVGRRALLQSGGQHGENGEEGEALALVLPMARMGLSLLSKPSSNAKERFRTHPSVAELVTMTKGEPDAFAAASVALHVLRCTPCMEEMALLDRMNADTALPLRAAAADLAVMMSPTEGESIGTCEALGAEAVLFPGGVLAVYAAEPLAVRLVVEGGSTRDMRPGYWAGDVPRNAGVLEATLHVGDKSAAWKITLPR